MTRPVKPPVYAIADQEALAPLPLSQAVAEMALAGIRWVQVRAKHLGGRAFYHELEEVLRCLEGTEVELWVNDRVDLAALFPVAGVHLGQDDLEPPSARRVLGAERRIGLSTHNLDQVQAADRDPAVDVVAVGPIFATRNKTNPDPVVGLPGLRAARQRTGKTLVAIGGIHPGNLAQVLGAGADAAAMIGALCGGEPGPTTASARRRVGRNCREALAVVGG